MKNKTFILLLFFAAAQFSTLSMANATAQAQSTENPATPEVFNEPGAKLLFTEINFKNKTNDWVEFYYESPTKKRFNLKNFTFQDDNVFKTIGADFWLNSGEYYVLEFKDSDPDNQTNRLLTTTRSGLTGTTEQIILKDPSGKILDAACWSSDKPTSDEVTDMKNLFEAEGWISAEPSSCFPSAKVTTNQSIVRINFTDTDSVNDWTSTDDISPGKANNEVSTSSPDQTNSSASPAASSPSSSGTSSQSATNSTSTNSDSSSTTTSASNSSENPANAPSGLSIDELAATSPTAAKSSTSKTTSTKASTSKTSSTSKKATTTKKSTSKKTYKNGDLSNEVMISEIFPHAETDDRTNEWIELTNTSDNDVNLGNWQLDDLEGGSKPYIIPDTITIQAHTALVIKAPDSKLSLSNTKDQARLFDPEGKLLQTVDFEEAPKNQSYAAITIQKEDGTTEQQWLWETTPTPGQINPDYHEITGTVSQNPQFGNQYSFDIKDAKNQNYTILFNEALIAGPMAQATFQVGTPIKVTGILSNGTEESESTQELEGQLTQQRPNPQSQSEQNSTGYKLLLKKYEVLGAAQTPQSSNDTGTSPWMFLGMVPPGGAGFWFGLKKIRKIYGKI